jgi:DNA modification methylase
LYRSSGDRLLTPSEIAQLDLKAAMAYFNNLSYNEVYDYKLHVQIAEELLAKNKLPPSFAAVAPQSWMSDVWTDITRMRTLNTFQGQRQEQQHLCPLPFDIVERCIYRYSNPGDLICDPFGGMLTTALIANQLERKAWVCELSPDYFKIGVSYLLQQDYQKSLPTLFSEPLNQAV